MENIDRSIRFWGNYNKVEVVVVNNNSSDKTEEVAKQYGAKVVFEEINQIAKARNKGASCAQGEYLIFIDADTLMNERLIKRVLS